MSFTQQTFDFLAALAANNSKDWFDAHRDDYEAHWRGPALDFIEALSDRMSAVDPPLKAEPRLNGSLRRINRDVRFSKDKTPYNARLHMIFWAGGHPSRSAAVHLVLNPKGVGYGAGQFGLEPKALLALRHRIVDPKDGQALMDALEQAQSVGCRMGPPDLARRPKGFDVAGPRADLLRHKGIVARTFDQEAKPSKICGSGAADWVMEVTAALTPLVRWLHPSD